MNIFEFYIFVLDFVWNSKFMISLEIEIMCSKVMVVNLCRKKNTVLIITGIEAVLNLYRKHPTVQEFVMEDVQEKTKTISTNISIAFYNAWGGPFHTNPQLYM